MSDLANAVEAMLFEATVLSGSGKLVNGYVKVPGSEGGFAGLAPLSAVDIRIGLEYIIVSAMEHPCEGGDTCLSGRILTHPSGIFADIPHTMWLVLSEGDSLAFYFLGRCSENAALLAPAKKFFRLQRSALLADQVFMVLPKGAYGDLFFEREDLLEQKTVLQTKLDRIAKASGSASQAPVAKGSEPKMVADPMDSIGWIPHRAAFYLYR